MSQFECLIVAAIADAIAQAFIAVSPNYERVADDLAVATAASPAELAAVNMRC